ncbi:MAG: cobalamin biosynthesis protein [Ignisphaera sp.]|nr:cobalamin biosynthesis protein [Ignisphaera sp.]MCX8168207.1 cobalamin biosynthesis protein [Ignisphaera sp.]MDW8084923.1 cobalamin biosynthesis protein [Ignisphaera sp.]
MYMIPDFLYPKNPYLIISTVLVAHIFDFLYPFHKGFLLMTHPVHTSYVIAIKIGKKYSSRLRGVVAWFLTVSLHLAAYVILLYVAWLVHPLIWVLVSSWLVKVSISLRLLISIVKNVERCSNLSNWQCARFWTQQIVRRNVYEIDEEHVLSAAIESLAESLVDGYISPLFYILFLGPIGALLQRIINTLDGALGFKTDEYRKVGWFSAKADTVINFIPARLTALIMILLAPLVGTSTSYAYTIWREYHSATESLNAGHPISAMAGTLMVRLEKIGSYTIGNNVRSINGYIVEKGLNIAIATAIIWTSLICSATLCIFLL